MTNAQLHRRMLAREALLEAAEKLFVARGYTAVSTRDLAEAAGVNLGAIQYHFGSKGKLFVEAVRVLMARHEHKSPFAVLDGDVADPKGAAKTFALFVFRFLHELANPSGPDVCRVIFRETFSETTEDPEMFESLVTSVVEEFHRPSFTRLVRTLSTIAPGLSAQEIELHAHSVIAQCTFYRTHEPFLGRLSECVITEQDSLHRVGRHISGMTLRSLGCGEPLIAELLIEAEEDSRSAERLAAADRPTRTVSGRSEKV